MACYVVTFMDVMCTHTSFMVSYKLNTKNDGKIVSDGKLDSKTLKTGKRSVDHFRYLWKH